MAQIETRFNIGDHLYMVSHEIKCLGIVDAITIEIRTGFETGIHYKANKSILCTDSPDAPKSHLFNDRSAARNFLADQLEHEAAQLRKPIDEDPFSGDNP